MISPDLVELFPAGQDLLGKSAGDLVKDLQVLEDGTVRGTFHHVTGYTGFSSNVAEQSGYYFPFKLGSSVSGETMTFKKNGMPTKQGIPFDPEIVFPVTAGDTFEVVVDESSVVTFNFARATFEPAAFSAAGGTPEKAAPLAGKPQGKTAAPPAAKTTSKTTRTAGKTPAKRSGGTSRKKK